MRKAWLPLVITCLTAALLVSVPWPELYVRANFRLMLPSRMEIVRRVQAADYWENRSHVRVCRTMGSDWKRRVCGPEAATSGPSGRDIRAGIERPNEATHHIGRLVGKIYFFPELFSDTLPQKTQALPP